MADRWARLSGRWRWVALAAAVGAAVGGAAGWWGVTAPTYRAEAMVRLGLSAATRADGAAALAMESAVERELALLRTLGGSAAADALWVTATRPEATATRLLIEAQATDPATAAEALRHVMAGWAARTTLPAAAERDRQRRAAEAELATLRAGAAAAAAGVAQTRAAWGSSGGGGGAGDLEAMWDEAVRAEADARRRADVAKQRAESLAVRGSPTREELATFDPEAAAWWGRLRAIHAELVAAVWPPNPSAAVRLRERGELERKLDERAADSRVVPVGDGGVAFRAVRVSEAEARAEARRAELERASARVAALRPRVAAWRAEVAEASRAASAVAEAEAALAALEPGEGVRVVETAYVGGGDEPTVAVWRDWRWAWAAGLAALGALWGAGGLGLVFALDRRVRRTADGKLIGSSLPVLGAMPTLSGAADSRDAEVGGGGFDEGGEVRSIQGLRAILEARLAANDTRRRVGSDGEPRLSEAQGGIPGAGGAFAVTGVAAGSGATSVAVGLAVSMALSGTRVLLIDLAWLQKPAGGGSDDEATRDGLGVDGVIEELGYLEDEDRERLALGDEAAAAGFGAMLGGASLRRSVVQTRIENLAVLSAMGRGAALRKRWAGRVSSRWLGKLYEVSRRGGYTATLIDAGSATGSVEGMLGCAVADGTVVVVSGEQTQPAYAKAVNRLRVVGASVIGTVLNRHDGLGRRPGAVARARAAGGTSGSGIFAAAVEARSGSAGGGDTGGVPLPRIDDVGSEAETVLEAGGEPPTQVGPTPTRVPPRSGGSVETPPADTAGLAEALAGGPPPEVPPEAPPEASPGLSPEALPPELEIEVADDVMDQLVDHAIRAAQRPRSGVPAEDVGEPGPESPS
ncbi:MAG: hypothetical protein AAFX76_11545 [Planctomycetota bacterium]